MSRILCRDCKCCIEIRGKTNPSYRCNKKKNFGVMPYDYNVPHRKCPMKNVPVEELLRGHKNPDIRKYGPINKDLNFKMQFYNYKNKTIKLKLIDYNYTNKKAKWFKVKGLSIRVWIPNKHLDDKGILLPDQNIDYVFRDIPKLNRKVI